MMKTMEIVSHCFAAKLPHYAMALHYQLSSLVLDPPKDCRVQATVCFNHEDEKTLSVLEWFAAHTELRMKLHHMSPGHLGRRAIGRNEMALETEADIVWFADVDQCYREGILDRLAALPWPVETLAGGGGAPASMIFPRQIMIHRDHAMGDECLRLADGTKTLLDVDPNQFVTKVYGRAIGGVQIVRGNFARRHGYLDRDLKRQTPTDGRFASCKCDRPYRTFCRKHGPILKVNLPGLYRLRHSVSGHGRSPSTGGAGFQEGTRCSARSEER